MVLGRLPTMPVGLKGQRAQASDRDIYSRRLLNAWVNQHFFINDLSGFEDAPATVQRLLLGMLAKSPEDRWNASEALEMALRVALAEGLEPRDAVSLPELPDEWFRSDSFA